jgi:hypothetical protein
MSFVTCVALLLLAATAHALPEVQRALTASQI